MQNNNAPFDGRKFKNQVNPAKKSLKDFWHWQWTKKPGKWPKWVDIGASAKVPERVYGSDLKVTFVNHATVLIQTHGINILTDPVWSKRVSPFSWIGPKRVKAPGIALEDLPPIDIILISHDHYDHLDVNTLKKIFRHHRPKIYAGLKINKILNKIKLHCHELDWWQSHDYNDEIRIHFLPARHWSGRKAFYGNNSTLWGSFNIEAPSGNIYFAGDTGYCQHFKMIQQKFGSFRLSLLPIGAYEPRWFMRDSHTNPAEAVKTHQELNSAYSLAIHHGTFRLSDEGYDQPSIDLNSELAKLSLSPTRFRVLQEGESWEIEEK